MTKPLAPPLTTLIAALLAVPLIHGCAVGPDYERPAMALPQAWPAATATPTTGTAATKADSAGERWWSLYADPVLDRLTDEALAYNSDAQLAAARVLEARALAGIADADRYPVLSAGLSGNRTQSTLKGAFPRPANLPRIQNTYRGTLDASYELDLWGRYRRASEAARAELFAAESARAAVRLSLTAQVAQQYFALLAADAQEGVARRMLTTRGETLALFAKRDRKSTRLNSSHIQKSRMPSSA